MRALVPPGPVLFGPLGRESTIDGYKGEPNMLNAEWILT